MSKKEAVAPKTKKCPYCCEDIPLAATRCPHCTSALEEEKSAAVSAAPKKRGRKAGAAAD